MKGWEHIQWYFYCSHWRDRSLQQIIKWVWVQMMSLILYCYTRIWQTSCIMRNQREERFYSTTHITTQHHPPDWTKAMAAIVVIGRESAKKWWWQWQAKWKRNQPFSLHRNKTKKKNKLMKQMNECLECASVCHVVLINVFVIVIIIGTFEHCLMSAPLNLSLFCPSSNESSLGIAGEEKEGWCLVQSGIIIIIIIFKRCRPIFTNSCCRYHAYRLNVTMMNTETCTAALTSNSRNTHNSQCWTSQQHCSTLVGWQLEGK